MAQYILVNAVGGRRAGDVLDDLQGDASTIAGLQLLGGVLIPLPNAAVEAAAVQATAAYAAGAGDEIATGIMLAKTAAAGAENNKVAVSAADSTPNFLADKLAAGAGVSLAILNPGGDEKVVVTATGVASVTATAPAVSSGGDNPDISIVPASALVPGSMSAANFLKLAGIEALADVTDFANVAAALAAASGAVSFNDQALTSVASMLLSSGARVSSGAGSPNGAVVGSVGDLWLRTDGGTSTALYCKTSGVATNTGWQPVITPARGTVTVAFPLALPGALFGTGALFVAGALPGQSVHVSGNFGTTWVLYGTDVPLANSVSLSYVSILGSPGVSVDLQISTF